MLAAILLAGLVSAPLTTLALFAFGHVPRRLSGRWPWTRRLVNAIIGSALTTAATAAVLDAIGATYRNTIVATACVTAMSLAWLPYTRAWNARGHLCWSQSFLLLAAYLAFMIQWTFDSHLGALGTVGAFVLWGFEAVAAVLGAAYLWELCDALGREQWRRRSERGVLTAEMATLPTPFVSLHVPAHNEPPDMVIATLESLLHLDYPSYEIVLLDDNTTDPAIWQPVATWCAERGVRFVHLEDWPGYKSGALNYALAHATDPRAELIGIIDSDYQLDPQFLTRCAPLFADPRLGFVQTPQDYRDWDVDPFYRRLYYSYRYFFAVSQPSRNERDGAIFAGTMGLIRREALEAVGGWDEWCITEDAELSLRLLRKGWSGLHVDRSFGKGIMPLTFEALKSQRFRWCFGGIQILRKQWRHMLPGPRTDDNQMRLRQRWAYLSGAVQWYGDLLGLTFYFFLLAGAANIAAGGGLLFRKLSGFLMAAIPLMAVLGIVRAAALLRRGTGATWREAIGAFMVWQSTTLVVARASVQALFAREAEFLRTPKTAEDASAWDALRRNWAESLLAVLGVVGIGAALTNVSSLSGPLTAVLLIWPTLAFASAPLNSRAALRAALPDQLRARRRTEYLRANTTRRLTAAVAAVAALGGAAAAALILITPAGPVQSPRLLGPARGDAAPHHHIAPAVHNSTTPTTPVEAHSPSAPPSTAGGSPSSRTSPPAAAGTAAPTTTNSPSPVLSPSASTATPSASPTPSPIAPSAASASPTVAAAPGAGPSPSASPTP